MKKKVLIIAYYWPPSGGAGVQRWLKLSKYLCELGVDVHVLTVDENYASYPQLDQSLNQDIHPDVKIYKTKSFEAINIYSRMVGKENVPTAGFSNVDSANFKQKLVTSIRSNFFIPDPRKGWKKYAVKKASEIIQKENIKTIITTSPPHSTQLIGLALKSKFSLKWIVDFRDPWTDIFYYDILRHTWLSHKYNSYLERKVIEVSDQIITVSDGFKKSFLSKTNRINPDKILIIHNGFDPKDFEGVNKIKNEDTFLVTYTGTISEQYEPQIFFDALHDLSLLHPKINIKFQLVGSIASALEKYILSLGLNFEYIHTVPHSEIISYQKQADLLLLAIPNVKHSKGIQTGKLFEYLASSNNIIGIGPNDGDIADILKECNAGQIFDRTDKKIILQFLEKMLYNYKNNIPSKVNKTAIQKFSRKYQAALVKNLL